MTKKANVAVAAEDVSESASETRQAYATPSAERGAAPFELYSLAVGGVTHDGKPIPGWGELSERVKAGWNAVYDWAKGKE